MTLLSESRLKASDGDQSYLPDSEEKIEFKMSFFKMIK